MISKTNNNNSKHSQRGPKKIAYVKVKTNPTEGPPTPASSNSQLIEHAIIPVRSGAGKDELEEKALEIRDLMEAQQILKATQEAEFKRIDANKSLSDEQKEKAKKVIKENHSAIMEITPESRDELRNHLRPIREEIMSAKKELEAIKQDRENTLKLDKLLSSQTREMKQSILDLARQRGEKNETSSRGADSSNGKDNKEEVPFDYEKSFHQHVAEAMHDNMIDKLNEESAMNMKSYLKQTEFIQNVRENRFCVPKDFRVTTRPSYGRGIALGLGSLALVHVLSKFGLTPVKFENAETSSENGSFRGILPELVSMRDSVTGFFKNAIYGMSTTEKIVQKAKQVVEVVTDLPPVVHKNTEKAVNAFNYFYEWARNVVSTSLCGFTILQFLTSLKLTKEFTFKPRVQSRMKADLRNDQLAMTAIKHNDPQLCDVTERKDLLHYIHDIITFKSLERERTYCISLELLSQVSQHNNFVYGMSNEDVLRSISYTIRSFSSMNFDRYANLMDNFGPNTAHVSYNLWLYNLEHGASMHF